MSSPNYEKSYTFFANQAYSPPDALTLAKYAIWFMKAFLTGQIGGATQGLWTVESSCDGAAYGNNDSVDRWGATFDGTKIVFNTAGNAHSWCVLKSPTVNGRSYRVLLDASGNTTGSITKPRFAVMQMTGGSLTAAPTAVTQAMAGTLSSTYTPVDPTVGPGKFHMALSTDGMTWYLLHSIDGGNRFDSAWIFGAELTNARAGDTAPAFLFVQSSAASGNLLLANLMNTISVSSIGGCLHPATYGGALAQQVAVFPIPTLPGMNYVFGNAAGTAALDTNLNSFLDAGVWIHAWAQGGNVSLGSKGRLQDFAWGHFSQQIGSLVDDQATTRFILVGEMWVPYNTIPVL